MTLPLPAFIKRNNTFWIWVIVFSIPLYFGTIFIINGFSAPDIIQDDGRQGIIYLQKIWDPQLFKDDYIAQYCIDSLKFNSPGVFALYKVALSLKIQPIFLAKLLPLFLAIISSYFCFKFSYVILPNYYSSVLSVLIFNQCIWLNRDLSSATARAFLFPLFSAFLYFLSDRKMWRCIAVVILQGIFYSPIILVEIGILFIRTLHIGQGKIKFLPKNMRWAIIGLVAATIALIPVLILSPKIYGPMISVAEMKNMPEFYTGGTTPFFVKNPFEFWFVGPSGLTVPVYPIYILLGLLLPLQIRAKQEFTNKLSPQKIILLQGILVSLALFILAHLLLFKLYWPNRYIRYTFPILQSVAASISISTLGDNFQNWLQHIRHQTLPRIGNKIWITVVACLCCFLVIYYSFPSLLNSRQGWVKGEAPEIYRYLRQQPKDSLIASLSLEADNIPAFALRPVLVSQELALPFNTKYYAEIRNRISALIEAQYSDNFVALKRAITTYHLRYWLIDRNAFSVRYLERDNSWLMQFRETWDIIHNFKQGKMPIFPQIIDQCSVAKSKKTKLLSTTCILKAIDASEIPSKISNKQGT